MKANQERLPRIRGGKRVVIPCVDWQVDEMFPVRIDQGPIIAPLPREYNEPRDYAFIPVVVVGPDFERATALNPKGRYLC